MVDDIQVAGLVAGQVAEVGKPTGLIGSDVVARCGGSAITNDETIQADALDLVVVAVANEDITGRIDGNTGRAMQTSIIAVFGRNVAAGSGLAGYDDRVAE